MPRRGICRTRRWRSSGSTYWPRCSAGRSWPSPFWGCWRAGWGCATAWRLRGVGTMVDLILLERVDKLGQMGQIVKVKPGYARNYLLPQKKAMRATKENLAYFETQRTQLEANNLHRKSEAGDVAGKVEGLTVVLIRQAGESGQLYGSVAARDIAEAVTKAGFTVDKQQIVLGRPIKTLGLHQLRVMLHPEVGATVTANVAQSEEGARMQAAGIDPLRERDEEEEAARREFRAAQAQAERQAPRDQS